MSKKFRRFYETAFDSKISKSDEDLLSAEKQDAAIAHRLSHQLQLSASTSSVLQQQQCNDGDGGGGVRITSSFKFPSKNRLLGFLLHKRRAGGGANIKYRSSDSVVTSSSISLESIVSDSLSSHSSESPCYNNVCSKRLPEPHVLSPISDKSAQDYADVSTDRERRSSAAAGVQARSKARPPQSLGLIKLNRDNSQHHGSDSGISVGSKPGDSYQELLDVPFDMPKLRRRQKPDAFRPGDATTVPRDDAVTVPEPLPFDMPKLRRKQTSSTASDGLPLPFDMPKLRKRQMDSCARVISLDFEIGSDAVAYDVKNSVDEPEGERLENLPFDMPKLKKIVCEGEKKPDRSGLFLNVKPNNCVAVNANNGPLPKIFQNKSECLFVFIRQNYDIVT